ncbi:MAG: Dihydrofolate synthase [Candidatus Ozemobacter sibiricus]|jgi:dihydrofolate synthase/folylpolyglutamate synthase|uniref:tetrahydrofolate synthase n=1 Tax=Candidatus Ozemobacter sibiricus TaxID=2268124 RepID=A0A367ZUQ2_9BACT|nr:MAG: Dihydrofolate synthase [Candidatus Ozemobacter sibiricus]
MDLPDVIEWLTSRDLLTGPFGLHRMEYLMERLDHPQRQYPAVLIGGTNGKGSVTVLLESIMAATDIYQVGSTISPHLVDLTERIRLQTGPMPAKHWIAGATALQDIVSVMDRESSLGPPSFFELVTALAFFAFREADLDLAVVEVGLGGRLDATNVCHPEVSIITNIGTDHRELLGPDRPSIAREKLGILRPKRPLITAERDPEILAIFREVCQKARSPLIEAHPQNFFDVIESTAHGHRLRLRGVDGDVHLPLPGLHQLDNLALVLAAVQVLSDHGFEIPPAAIARGISRVSWPGRLQWLPGNPPILVDGAHNAEGLASLTGFLDRFPLERPCHLILGSLQKKPGPAMAAALAPYADTLAFVPPTSSRALTRSEFDAQIAPLDVRWKWYPTLPEALEAGQNARTILLSGSLYLVADLLRLKGLPGGSRA